MKRLSSVYFAAAIAAAPALVIPFDGGEKKVVESRDVHSVESGLITLSPFAVFLLEARFFWERIASGRSA